VSYFASCAGLPVVAGKLLIPLVGAWTADLTLAGATSVSGTVSVVVGNLTLQGTVFRSETYGGQVKARLVGGYGGWRTSVPAQGYGSSAGINLSLVLGDVASACGEVVSVGQDAPIGNAFVRVNWATSVASDVLWQLVAQGLIPAWYVAPSGTTMVAAWPTTNVQTPFTITDQDADSGIVVVATEDYASWLPGAQFTNPLVQGQYTCCGVHYVWDEDGAFRLQVLTDTTEDRILGPLQQLVQKEIAPMRFFGRYEYVMTSATEETMDGYPADATLGLPDVQNVPLCSDAVSVYTPAAQAKAHVQFVDGKPTRPVCVWTDQTPTMAQLLGGPNPVARLGDQVQSILPPSLPVVVTVSGVPSPGVITAAAPIAGFIVQGSSQVSSA
jgi:hypothetical protein